MKTVKAKLAPFNDILFCLFSAQNKQENFSRSLKWPWMFWTKNKFKTSDLIEFLKKETTDKTPHPFAIKLAKIKYLTRINKSYPAFLLQAIWLYSEQL